MYMTLGLGHGVGLDVTPSWMITSRVGLSPTLPTPLRKWHPGCHTLGFSLPLSFSPLHSFNRSLEEREWYLEAVFNKPSDNVLPLSCLPKGEEKEGKRRGRKDAKVLNLPM